MATHLNFYLNGVKINPPKNWKEFGIQLNFDKDKETVKQQVSITDFEFVRENTDIINKWITDGLSTGVGVFEGIPFKIEVERNGTVEVPFNGYLDLTQATGFSNIRSTVKSVEVGSIDWLNDVADSFTFDYLYDSGKITDNDFVAMPYIINSIPNYTDAAVSVLGVYVMVKEIKDAIQKLIEFVSDMPVYYVFSTYIKLILYIIYLILLIIALIKLVKTIILLIIQPVKYHKCMSLYTQLSRGADALGMTFRCPILENGDFADTYIIPSKYYNPTNKKESQILGFTDPSIEQIGYYKGTYGDLLRETKKVFNAKILIKNNREIWLVRDDFTESTNQYTLPPIYNPTFNINASEFNSNTYITFLTDGIDKNTMQDFQGTSYQVITQPSRVINQNMVLMKGLDEIRINFALAKRKETFTDPEKIFNVFLKVFDAIVGALVKVVNAIIFVLNLIITLVNNILKKLATIGIKIKFQLPLIPKVNMPNFKNDIENRIGMLIIEKDIINLPKICLITLGDSAKYNKLHVSNRSIMSAQNLYNNFHFVKSFVPTSEKPNANQYYLKNYENVPFTFDDYLKVKENNSIFTSDGEEAQVDSLEWNVWNQKANFKIRINKLYTNNFGVTTLEPDGS